MAPRAFQPPELWDLPLSHFSSGGRGLLSTPGMAQQDDEGAVGTPDLVVWPSISPPVQLGRGRGSLWALALCSFPSEEPPFLNVYQLPLVETPVALGLDQGFPSSRMLSVLQVGKLRLWEQRD